MHTYLEESISSLENEVLFLFIKFIHTVFPTNIFKFYKLLVVIKKIVLIMQKRSSLKEQQFMKVSFKNSIKATKVHSNLIKLD